MRGFISDISFDAPRLCCNPKKLRTGQSPSRRGCKFNALNSEELMSFFADSGKIQVIPRCARGGS